MRRMKLFRSKAEKQLDSIIAEIKVNLENNYKSLAHDARRRLGEAVETLHDAGQLDDKLYKLYRGIYEDFTEKMKDYHH